MVRLLANSGSVDGRSLEADLQELYNSRMPGGSYDRTSLRSSGPMARYSQSKVSTVALSDANDGANDESWRRATR